MEVKWRVCRQNTREVQNEMLDDKTASSILRPDDLYAFSVLNSIIVCKKSCEL